MSVQSAALARMLPMRRQSGKDVIYERVDQFRATGFRFDDIEPKQLARLVVYDS